VKAPCSTAPNAWLSFCRGPGSTIVKVQVLAGMQGHGQEPARGQPRRSMGGEGGGHRRAFCRVQDPKRGVGEGKVNREKRALRGVAPWPRRPDTRTQYLRPRTGASQRLKPHGLKISTT